jgi:hypothetical protein
MILNQKLRYLINIICFCSNVIQFPVNRRRNSEYTSSISTKGSKTSISCHYLLCFVCWKWQNDGFRKLIFLNPSFCHFPHTKHSKWWQLIKVLESSRGNKLHLLQTTWYIFAGLAEQVRLLLTDQQIPFEDIRLAREQWYSIVKKTMVCFDHCCLSKQMSKLVK